MAELMFCSTEQKTENFPFIQTFLKTEGIEIGKFPLNELSREYQKLDTLSDEQRRQVLASYSEISAMFRERQGFKEDMICLYPEFEHMLYVLDKFGSVHYHFEHEYWYFIDGFFHFVFLGSRGVKYQVKVESGEYLQVPEGKWQYFYGDQKSYMKAMRFFYTTGTYVEPKIDVNQLIETTKTATVSLSSAIEMS